MYRAFWLVGIVFLLTSTVAQAAELSIPDCKGLLDWGQTYHPSHMIDIAPKIQLVNIFGDEISTQVFGKRALDWNPEEYRAVSTALRACARKYRKQKDAAKVFTTANSAMGRSLRRVQNYFARLDRAFESVRKRLLDQPETARTYKNLADYDTAGKIVQHYRQLAGAPAERTDALARDITAYRTKLRHDAVEKTAQSIKDLPEAPRALLAISKQVHQVLTDYDDQPEREDLAALEKLSQERRDSIRDALMAGAGDSPPMLFPPCDQFITWAAAANVQRPIQTGAGFFYDALLDEKVVPVFAKPVDVWTDDEVALFREGMQFCTQSMLQDRSHGAQAPQGIQQASVLGSNLPTARATIAKYKTARLARKQQTERIAAIEPTLAGLRELSRMQSAPFLAMLSREEQQSQRFGIQNRQRQISAVVIDDSIQKLEDFEPSLKGLEEIGNYRLRVLRTLQGFAEPNSFQRFENAFRARDAEIAAAALPEFRSKLKELPIAPESREASQKTFEVILAPRRSVSSSMQGYQGTARFNRVPPAGYPGRDAVPDYLIPYHEATEARVNEIAVELHEAQCNKVLADTKLPAGVKQQKVLGPLGPTTIGDFICRMIMTGREFHSFENSGGEGYALKITAQPMGYQTIALHKGEVAPGEEMLVGYTVSDANVERTLTVQEWQSYAGMLTGQAAETGLRMLEQLFKGVGQRLQQMQQKSQR